MKRLFAVLAAATLTGLAWAKGVEQVSVVENEITTITVPFAISSYQPSNKEVVRIDELSGTSLRITALKRGRCDLEVRGDKELSQKYEITVLGDLATTLETLTSELEQVQEVRARIVGNFIRVDGEISSIKKWEYLQKVLRGYKGVVNNFAVFSPGPDVMLRLKDTLQDAGFKVVFQSLGKNRKAWEANTLALLLNKQTHIMTVQGRVYTPEQQQKVTACLATERWLALDLKPAEDSATDEEFRIRTQFDVFVDRPQIRISLAYMAISDGDIKRIGNANARNDDFMAIGSTLRSIQSLIPHQGGEYPIVKNAGLQGDFAKSRHGANNAVAGVSLNVITRFFKENQINRISDTGYTVMESWEKDGAQFKSGGTIYVKVAGADAADLKEIPYGFILSTKGGIVPEGDAVDATIDFMVSTVAQSPSGDYDREEKVSKQKVLLPLGKTTFLGGIKMLDEDRLSPSGLPYLRNTPMLNWFVADSGTEVSDRRLVIMVSPEIIDNSTGERIDTVKEVDIPVTTEGAKTTEQREDEKLENAKQEKQRRFGGGLWNPLNWFVF